MNSELWNKVESALVGGLNDATAKFAMLVATGNYALHDIEEVARELNLVLMETNKEYYSRI